MSPTVVVEANTAKVSLPSFTLSPLELIIMCSSVVLLCPSVIDDAPNILFTVEPCFTLTSVPSIEICLPLVWPIVVVEPNDDNVVLPSLTSIVDELISTCSLFASPIFVVEPNEAYVVDVAPSITSNDEFVIFMCSVAGAPTRTTPESTLNAWTPASSTIIISSASIISLSREPSFIANLPAFNVILLPNDAIVDAPSFKSTPLSVILTCSLAGSPTFTPVESTPNCVVVLFNNSNPEPDICIWEPVVTPIWVKFAPNNDWVTPASINLTPALSKLAVVFEAKVPPRISVLVAVNKDEVTLPWTIDTIPLSIIVLSAVEFWTWTAAPVITTFSSITSTALCAFEAAVFAFPAVVFAVLAVDWALAAWIWAALAVSSFVNPLSLFKSDISISPGFVIVILPFILNDDAEPSHFKKLFASPIAKS